MTMFHSISLTGGGSERPHALLHHKYLPHDSLNSLDIRKLRLKVQIFCIVRESLTTI